MYYRWQMGASYSHCKALKLVLEGAQCGRAAPSAWHCLRPQSAVALRCANW